MGCCGSREVPRHFQEYATASPSPQSTAQQWEVLNQLDLPLYSQLQNAYLKQWRMAEVAFDLPAHDGGHMDYPLLKRLKPFLILGAPDSALPRVLTRLFRLNSSANAERFSVNRKYFAGREECLFGRSTQSSLKLSAAGQQVRPR